MTEVRPAERSEISALARLWYDGWQDAHAAILPEALARGRTLESFAARLEAALGDVSVIGPIGAPLGLCMLKGKNFTSSMSRQRRGVEARRPLSSMTPKPVSPIMEWRRLGWLPDWE